MPQEALYDIKIHVLHLELTSHLLPLTRMAGYACFLFRKVEGNFNSFRGSIFLFRRTMSCYIISNDILLSEPEFKNILDCGDYMDFNSKGL